MRTYWDQHLTDTRGVIGRCGTGCRSDRAFPGAFRAGASRQGLRRRATITTPFGVETGSLRVMAVADPPSMACSADLGKDVDGLPAQTMTGVVGHAPNGGAIVKRRLMPLRALNRPFNAIASRAVTRISSDDRGGAEVDKSSHVPVSLNITSDKSNRQELRILRRSIAGFNSILPTADYF